MDEEKSTNEAPVVAKSAATNTGKSTVTAIGVAALVIGIVAILSGWVPVWGLLVGAAAIVFGAIALKKSKANKGFGITGIVLGAVAALTSLMMTIFWIIGLTALTVASGSVLQASKNASDALSAQNAIAQKEIDAKKDFNKGDTATFGTFTVKVNSVNLNYVPDNTYEQAGSGSKYVVVNMTVANPGDTSTDVDPSSIELNADGVSKASAYAASVSPMLVGGSLDKGASLTGNIVYTVPATASTLKLQYTTMAMTTSPSQMKNLTYTLAL